jgi:serine/threonine protein kinase
LGKGAMCKVYHVFNRADPSKDYAVRLMKVPDPDTIEKIKIETAVMTMCSNKNIINYTTSYYYKNCLFMFIEFMDGGSLTEIIYQYIKKIDQNVIAYVLKEILQGLLPLHEQKQIHRDLKSDNILINKKG